MSDHPIEGLMKTAMESIKKMIDVNTIVGDAVESLDGSVIIPISKVSFGFAAGGAEYQNCNGRKKELESSNDDLPFGGGSGAGVSVQPVAFLVVGNGQIKMLSVDQNVNALNNLFEFIPNLANVFQNSKVKNKEKEEKNKTKE